MNSRRQQVTIRLTDEQQATLETITHTGVHRARVINRARALLMGNHNQPHWFTQIEIANQLGINQATVSAIFQRFAQEGLEGALYDKPRSGRPVSIDGKTEAHLVVLACSDPPEGKVSWTMTMLADKMVELEYVDSISRSTVHDRLKKTKSSLG
jgi:transposase